MAALQERNGSYRILFRHHGKQFTFTLGKVSPDEAEAKAKQVDYLLLRIKQRLINVPPNADIVGFLAHDGHIPQAADGEPVQRNPVTLGGMADRYLATHANGTIEQNSLDTCRLHLSHFRRRLGEAFPLQELSPATLQDYVNTRAKDKVRPVTVKKEIATLRAAWNWGQPMKLTAGQFPGKWLRYPKETEKPPFQTWEEIESQVAAGANASLWDCLYLKLPEISELMKFVREHAHHPWLYPLFCFAAHTGARRSEMLRTLKRDVDFGSGTVLIREKKRQKGKVTSRRVPLSALLAKALKDWLAVHPGGDHLFAHRKHVIRSRTKRAAATPITKDEAHDHLKRVLAGSNWKVLRGYHALRHSFISALASRGVDQRIIDDFVGHQTDEQRRRYRHLYPSTKQNAIKSVFG